MVVHSPFTRISIWNDNICFFADSIYIALHSFLHFMLNKYDTALQQQSYGSVIISLLYFVVSDGPDRIYRPTFIPEMLLTVFIDGHIDNDKSSIVLFPIMEIFYRWREKQISTLSLIPYRRCPLNFVALPAGCLFHNPIFVLFYEYMIHRRWYIYQRVFSKTLVWCFVLDINDETFNFIYRILNYSCE